MKKVDLMQDPDDGKPQILTKEDKDVHWKSRDYTGGSSPPPFRLVFNMSPDDLRNLLESSVPPVSTDPATGRGQLESLPGSDAKGPFQLVEARFNNHATSRLGYRYSVWMGEMEMDPRVQPR